MTKTNMHISKNQYGKPMKLMFYIQAYLWFTVFQYFYGPIKWYTQNSHYLVLLVSIFHFSLSLGYLWGNKSYLKKSESNWTSDEFILRYLKFSIITGIFISLVSAMRFSDGISISNIIKSVYDSIIDPSTQYHKFRDLVSNPSQQLGGPILTSLITFTGPMLVSSIPS